MSDFEGASVSELRGEVIRIRNLLLQYKDQATSAVDASVDLTLADICEEGGTDEEHSEACVNEIIHFRKMLRNQTLQAQRQHREVRRRMSAQGKMLAKFALSSIDIVDDSDDSDGDDDELPALPDKSKITKK